MTDKIILNIKHSDDYTDYLFLTAALTNRRIFPLLDPRPEEIRRLSDSNTKVIRCYNSRNSCGEHDMPISYDEPSGALRILSRYFLEDDGTVNAGKAESLRAMIEETVTERLMAPGNLLEYYRHFFPLYWRKRQTIFDNPLFFYVRSGWYGGHFIDAFPIGVILKAIEEDPANFRLSLRGGCSCSEPPLLIEYPSVYDTGRFYKLYTWCPACGARREIKAESFWRAGACDNSLEMTRRYYDKGQGFSSLSLFDLTEALRSS